jgi:hypothetical protein
VRVAATGSLVWLCEVRDAADRALERLAPTPDWDVSLDGPRSRLIDDLHGLHDRLTVEIDEAAGGEEP